MKLDGCIQVYVCQSLSLSLTFSYVCQSNVERHAVQPRRFRTFTCLMDKCLQLLNLTVDWLVCSLLALLNSYNLESARAKWVASSVQQPIVGRRLLLRRPRVVSFARHSSNIALQLRRQQIKVVHNHCWPQVGQVQSSLFVAVSFSNRRQAEIRAASRAFVVVVVAVAETRNQASVLARIKYELSPPLSLLYAVFWWYNITRCSVLVWVILKLLYETLPIIHLNGHLTERRCSIAVQHFLVALQSPVFHNGNSTWIMVSISTWGMFISTAGGVVVVDGQ